MTPAERHVILQRTEENAACRAVCLNRRCMTDMDEWPFLCPHNIAPPGANPGGGPEKER